MLLIHKIIIFWWKRRSWEKPYSLYYWNPLAASSSNQHWNFHLKFCWKLNTQKSELIKSVFSALLHYIINFLSLFWEGWAFAWNFQWDALRNARYTTHRSGIDLEILSSVPVCLVMHRYSHWNVSIGTKTQRGFKGPESEAVTNSITLS